MHLELFTVVYLVSDVHLLCKFYNRTLIVSGNLKFLLALLHLELSSSTVLCNDYMVMCEL